MLANSKFDALALGRNGREIAALCDKHAVPCGAPEDLAVFLRALDENKHLAMEFWSVVARATERDASATSDPNALLSAIVEAVTAQNLVEFESAGPTQRMLVKRTAGMLAGEDIHAPVTPDPFAVARTPAAAEVIAKPEPAPEPAEIPLPHRGRQLRLVLSPEPQAAAQVESEPEREAAPFVIPLAAYAGAESERSAWPRILAGVLAVAIVAGGWFMLHRDPAALSRADNAISSAYASVVGGIRAPASTPASASPAQPVASSPVQAEPQSPQPMQTPPAEATAPPQPAAPVPAAVAAAPQPRGSAALEPSTSRASDRDTESDAFDAPQVVVPEALMRENLISSRVPVVPDSTTTSGIVMLQAVITSRGTVEHLRAISGDPALRRAAIDAASTWRYRPYLLDGTPVDVSTTITVNFGGDD